MEDLQNTSEAANAAATQPAPQSVNEWRPPAGLPDHAGQPIRPGVVFFALPPREIGPLCSADSSYFPGQPLLDRAAVIVLLIAFFVLPFGIMMIARMPVLLALGFSAVITFFGFVAYIFTQSHSAQCQYVGEDGIAQFRYRRKRSSAPQREVLLFKSAAALFAKMEGIADNAGELSFIKYSYFWKDAAGKKLLELADTYAKDPTPHSLDAIKRDFAQNAQRVWTSHLLKREMATLEKAGYLQFDVDSKHSIRVGKGFFEICTNGETYRCNAGDIAEMSFAKLEFHVQHKDARWFSSKGKFSCTFGHMPNAMLFMLAVETFVGREFTGNK